MSSGLKLAGVTAAVLTTAVVGGDAVVHEGVAHLLGAAALPVVPGLGAGGGAALLGSGPPTVINAGKTFRSDRARVVGVLRRVRNVGCAATVGLAGAAAAGGLVDGATVGHVVMNLAAGAGAATAVTAGVARLGRIGLPAGRAQRGLA